MDKTSFDKISQKLKDSPLYNLSMANKELFHSNFLAWFGNKYKREFKEIISNLLGHGSWPNEIKDDFKIVREYNHFDICIKNSSDSSRIIIENNKSFSLSFSKCKQKFLISFLEHLSILYISNI